MASSPTPQVVALAFLSQGHINPLMHFCLKLASTGIHVTFVRIKLKVGGIDFMWHDPKPLHNVSFKSLDLDLPEDFNPNNSKAWAHVLDMINNLEDLFDEILCTCGACCVISDCLFAWTQTSAQRLGIPRIAFWTASAAALSVDVHIPLLMSHGDIPITHANMDNIVDYIPGLTPLKAHDLPCMYYFDNNMTITDPGYVRKMARCSILKDDAWLVVNSFEELEHDTFNALRNHINEKCIGVGPLIPAKFLGLQCEDDKNHHHGVVSMFEEEIDCMQWLDNNKAPNSVIYISFGTASSIILNQEEFDELSRGIEESASLFLWVHGRTESSKVSIDSFEAFKERTKTKGQGLVIPWAPQMDVLSHPSVGAFLTHCGWNSVLEAICTGVPMLGLPKQAEQTLNCKIFVEDLKVGLRLSDASVGNCPTRNHIADKVRKILCDEGIRDRARLLKDVARSSIITTSSPIEGLISNIYQFAKSN